MTETQDKAAEDFKKDFSIDFQKTLLRLILDDPNLLIKCSKFLKKHYFETEILGWVYDLILTHYNSYDRMVNEQVFISEIKGLKDDTKILEYVTVVKGVLGCNTANKEYICDKLEEFIKRNIFVQQFEKIVKNFNSGYFDRALMETDKCMEEIHKVSFDKEDRTFFFNEVKSRLVRRNVLLEKEEHDTRYTTGILELDSCIGGGLSKGELGIVVADAKVGKSICLVHIGASVVLSSFGANKVLHINLEGKDNQVEDRYEARILNQNYHLVRKNLILDYCSKREYMSPDFGKSLVIRNMIDRWDYTVLDIEEEIRYLASDGFVPSVIVIDYGDLLKPREVSGENSYISQQEIFRDLKTLANKFNCAVWTASQTTRIPPGKSTEDPQFLWTRHNLADSYAKVRIADLLFTLNATGQEKISKRMRIYLDAYRDNACGFVIPIQNNFENMQFYVPGADSMKKYMDSQYKIRG